MQDVMLARNPTNPFAHKPELGVELKNAWPYLIGLFAKSCNMRAVR